MNISIKCTVICRQDNCGGVGRYRFKRVHKIKCFRQIIIVKKM